MIAKQKQCTKIILNENNRRAKKEKKISISAVMFVFNEEKFISLMLDSILTQSYFVDQIVVCDDQSRDNTLAILNEYKEKYPERLNILQNKKKGKVKALEFALKSVKTSHFFLCHGDDKLEDSYVEDMLKELSSRKICFCYTSMKNCDEKLKVQKVVQLNRTEYDNDHIIARQKVGGIIFGKSELIYDILPFPDDLEFEDWYISLKLRAVYNRLYCNPKPLYCHRFHAGSDSFNKTYKKTICLINRDLRFFSSLLKDDVITNHFGKENIQINKTYYESLLNFTLSKSVTILFSSYIPLKLKIKFLIFPFRQRL